MTDMTTSDTMPTVQDKLARAEERIEELEDDLARVDRAPQTLEEARTKYEEFLGDLTADAFGGDTTALKAEIEELQKLLDHLQSYADFGDGEEEAHP